MANQKDTEVYAVIVHLVSGVSIEGYVQHGADSESGPWFIISRTPDMNSASFINRTFITHFDLAEIK